MAERTGTAVTFATGTVLLTAEGALVCADGTRWEQLRAWASLAGAPDPRLVCFDAWLATVRARYSLALNLRQRGLATHDSDVVSGDLALLDQRAQRAVALHRLRLRRRPIPLDRGHGARYYTALRALKRRIASGMVDRAQFDPVPLAARQLAALADWDAPGYTTTMGVGHWGRRVQLTVERDRTTPLGTAVGACDWQPDEVRGVSMPTLAIVVPLPRSWPENVWRRGLALARMDDGKQVFVLKQLAARRGTARHKALPERIIALRQLTCDCVVVALAERRDARGGGYRWCAPHDAALATHPRHDRTRVVPEPARAWMRRLLLADRHRGLERGEGS